MDSVEGREELFFGNRVQTPRGTLHYVCQMCAQIHLYVEDHFSFLATN